MDEEEFSDYLTAYIQASTGRDIGFPDSARWSGSARAKARLAVAGYDALAMNPPRTPAELVAEVDRICAGVIPTPAKAT